MALVQILLGSLVPLRVHWEKPSFVLCFNAQDRGKAPPRATAPWPAHGPVPPSAALNLKRDALATLSVRCASWLSYAEALLRLQAAHLNLVRATRSLAHGASTKVAGQDTHTIGINRASCADCKLRCNSAW